MDTRQHRCVEYVDVGKWTCVKQLEGTMSSGRHNLLKCNAP
jgi:hypothetical protein